MIALVENKECLKVQCSTDEEDEDDGDGNEKNDEPEHPTTTTKTTTTTTTSEQDESQRSEDDDEDQFLPKPFTSSQPSLTPAPQTPIEDLRSSRPNSTNISCFNSDGDQLNDGLLRQSTAIVNNACEHQVDNQGPALICTLAKSSDEASGDEIEEVNEEEKVDGQLLAVDLPEDFNSVVVIDEYNPELEYFSDPDNHDERPGKKSLVELEGERRLRRDLLKRQRQMSFGGSGGASEDEEIQIEGESSGVDDEKNFSYVTQENNNNLIEQEYDQVECSSRSEAPEHWIKIQNASSIESSEQETPPTSRTKIIDTSQDIVSLGNFIENEVGPISIQEATSNEVNFVQEQTRVDNEEEASTSRGSSGTIHSVASKYERRISLLQRLQADSLDNIEDIAESECQVVTASEANAESFVDESTLAEDLCSNFRLDSHIVNSAGFTIGTPGPVTEWPTSIQVKGEDDDEYPPSECDAFDDEDDEGTLNGCEIEDNLVERIDSLDDIKSEVLDTVPEIDNIEKDDNRNSNKQRTMLVILLNDYCDKLVELIKEESLKQIEQISLKENSFKQMSLKNVLQIETSSTPDEICNEIATQNKSDPSKTIDTTMTVQTNKKIYTSSMYYEDQQQSFPTIQQQLERSRIIAQQLEGEDSNLSASCQEITSKEMDVQEKTSGNRAEKNNNYERARQMFKRRRFRMSRFTLGDSSGDLIESENFCPRRGKHIITRSRRASLEPANLTSYKRLIDIGEKTTTGRDSKMKVSISNSDQIDSDPANMTDTEYEAPRLRRRPLPARATTTPFGGRTSRLVEVSSKTIYSQEAENAFYKSNEELEAVTSSSNKCTKFKPFLDSSTLKDIERLRKWSPYVDFNEHNSVSPEVCLKLVQDLRSSTSSLEAQTSNMQVPSVVVQPCDMEKSNNDVTRSQELVKSCSGSKINKGAQLFERRQLLSSDWIVSSISSDGGCGDVVSSLATVRDKSSSNEFSNKLGDEMSESQTNGSNLLSRPSLTEETVLVADERGEQIVELAPVFMSHAQPKLELATITKTPSFSASSWRVIECDSPDLLTSREEEEEDEDARESQDEDIQDAPHIDDNVDDMMNVNFIHDNETTIEQVNEDRVAQNKPIEWGSWMKHIVSEQNISPKNEAACETITCRTPETSASPDGPSSYIDAYMPGLQARTQSRSSDIHQSVLTGWLPEVTTPTWLTTEDYPAVEKTVVNNSHHDYDDMRQTELVVQEDEQNLLPLPPRRWSCNSVTHPHMGQRSGKRSLILALQQNYQNQIDESGNNMYRSYRYPFADSDASRKGQSCSPSRISEASQASRPPIRQLNSVGLRAEVATFRGLRQSSEPRRMPYYSSRGETSLIEGEEEEASIEEGYLNKQMKSCRCCTSQRARPLNINIGSRHKTSREEQPYTLTRQPQKPNFTASSSRLAPMEELEEEACMFPTNCIRTKLGGCDNESRENLTACSLASMSNSSYKQNSYQLFDYHSSASISSKNRLDTKQATSDYSLGPNTLATKVDSESQQRQHPNLADVGDDMDQAKEGERMNKAYDWMDYNNFQMYTKRQEGTVSREQDSSIASICCLRVCVKLPNKAHRIVIYRRPKVTYVTRIDQ